MELFQKSIHAKRNNKVLHQHCLPESSRAKYCIGVIGLHCGFQIQLYSFQNLRVLLLKQIFINNNNSFKHVGLMAPYKFLILV